MRIFRRYFPLIFILLAYFSISAFFSKGFFPVHDNTQVERVYQMSKALMDGMFPVRWVQDLGYGYGYPIFNFYAPLPYYLGSAFNLLGFGLVVSTKMMFILGIIFSAITMFIFAYKFLGFIPALVSSAIYLYFPYHAVNVFVRGDVEEFFAYSFLPLIFLCFYKIYYIAKDYRQFAFSFKYIILFAVSFAFLIISHNLSAFMIGLYLVPGIVFSLIGSKYKFKTAYFYLFALILGVALSAFYWVPAIFEMQYTNVYSQIGGGANYKDHFVCLSQLWDSPWGYGGSTKGCVDGLSFKLGKINIMFSVISVLTFIYLLFRQKIKKLRFLYLSSFIFLIFSIFMATDYSYFIWKTVPDMSFLQYPWRFLNFVGLFMSLTIGFFVSWIKIKFDNKAAVLMAVFLILSTLFYNAKLFVPQEFTNYSDDYYKNTQRLNYTVSKISDEYMPKNFNKPDSSNAVPMQKIDIVRGGGKIVSIAQKTGDIVATVQAQNNLILRFNISYFPAWKIYVDGKKVEYKIENNGLYIQVPKGVFDIKAIFVQTPIEQLANVISLVGVFALFLAIIWYRSYGKTAVKKAS